MKGLCSKCHSSNVEISLDAETICEKCTQQQIVSSITLNLQF